jgi:propionyl-CoA carboxylase alpha chain
VITSVLVANRGEIARRVFRTCRALGLGTVAVYSDADADSPHVAEADVAVRLPGSTPAETYLQPALLVAAARRAGADAVHPGYGFLAEHAEFACAVVDAGLTWIGPSAAAIEAMGSKIEAKRLMAAAGVPVLPQLDTALLTATDLPVLIKASAGGGGRGMRVVTRLDDLADAVALARHEAESAFGDPSVFCEPYLADGHHVEVQVLADEHGTVWTVAERECSIQRRHQKVIEEAPSPLVQRTGGMRERLFSAASAAAKAIGYTGAGTVEFLAAQDGRFYFLETNTRLQVEHPVTECTTGLDLVALQFHVADGGRLEADPPPPSGHAIEARLYAEDPMADWQPQTGRLHRFSVPGVSAEFATGTAEAGLRLDSGVVAGSVVGIHYDPMLAKVIAWAPTRSHAAALLADTLAKARVHGLVTNRDLLVRVLRHPAFLAGRTDTGFVTTHDLQSVPRAAERVVDLSCLAAALALDSAARSESPVLPGISAGWRNVVSQPQRREFGTASGSREVRYRQERERLVADGLAGMSPVEVTPDRVVLVDDGLRIAFDVARYGDLVCVDSAFGSVAVHPVPRFPDPGEQPLPGSLRAPMPGTVIRMAVEPGARVRAGEPMLWLEAMKMQHRVDAPADGVVAELKVRTGQQVDAGDVLAVVSTERGSQ